MSEELRCKVSVIVPVYCVENYIDRCMKSLIRQTLKEIEIICICDRKDISYQALLNYKEKDCRIRVLEKKNTGVSSSRNAGIMTAKGKYLAFVDADDWIEKYTLETLYLTAEHNDAQIVVYGIWPTIEPEGERRAIFGYTPKHSVRYNGNGMKALVYEHGSIPYIGNKFYNRRFLKDNGILFDEKITMGEDHLLQFEVFGKAENICFIRDKMYHYDIARNASATNVCERQQETIEKNFRLLKAVMKKKENGQVHDREYIFWILQNYGWMVGQDNKIIMENRQREEVLFIQKCLREMLAERYIDEFPIEYQNICKRVMDNEYMEASKSEIQMSHKACDKYMADQVRGLYEEIVVMRGIRGRVRRIYEAFAFHEFRHLVVRACLRLSYICNRK